MPEGDTIFRTAATLQRWLGGREITSARARIAALATGRLVGAAVTQVEARGKHLLVHLSSGDVLHTHLGMTGSWHVYPAGERWQRSASQARLVLEAGDRVAVCFGAPVIELLAGRRVSQHPSLSRLGPDVLGDGFDPESVRLRARRRALAGAVRTVGEVLLDQQVASGIGNIYRCESLFACRVNPWQCVDDLDDARLDDLMLTAARLMRANATGRLGTRGFEGRAGERWVYRRSGRPCRRCGTTVRSQRLGHHARIVYWCPTCQPLEPPARASPGSLQSAAVVRIEVATEVTDELIEAFARLVPQLSSSSPAPGRPELAEMVAGPTTSVLLARDASGAIIGSLTLAVFRIPTGVRALIEDVMVDESARGSGAGTELTKEALAAAARAGARTVDLTSRPSREAANRLYQRLGFERRDTNVYRYQFPSAGFDVGGRRQDRPGPIPPATPQR
jgi:endonuclease-8